MTRNRRIALAALIAVVAAMSLSSCAKVMDTKKVQKSITNYLNENPGEETFDKVTCPKDKDAKKGVTFDCTFEGNEGTTGKVQVAVKNTKGDADLTYSEVKFPTQKVEDAIKDDIVTQFPDDAEAIESIECPESLPSKPKETAECTLSYTDETVYGLPITITDDFTPTWDLDEVVKK